MWFDVEKKNNNNDLGMSLLPPKLWFDVENSINCNVEIAILYSEKSFQKTRHSSPETL